MHPLESRDRLINTDGYGYGAKPCYPDSYPPKSKVYRKTTFPSIAASSPDRISLVLPTPWS